MPPSARKGFTLVELLVVISIIAILSVIGITVFTGVQKGARDAKRRGDLDAIAKALEIYKSQNNTYTPQTSAAAPCPDAFSTDFNDPNWGAEGQGNPSGCISIGRALSSYFASSIPHDPFCKANSSQCSNSWNDYSIQVPAGGSSFTLYVQLENGSGAIWRGYNYSIKNQQ